MFLIIKPIFIPHIDTSISSSFWTPALVWKEVTLEALPSKARHLTIVKHSLTEASEACSSLDVQGSLDDLSSYSWSHFGFANHSWKNSSFCDRGSLRTKTMNMAISCISFSDRSDSDFLIQTW